MLALTLFANTVGRDTTLILVNLAVRIVNKTKPMSMKKMFVSEILKAYFVLFTWSTFEHILLNNKKCTPMCSVFHMTNPNIITLTEKPRINV